MTLWDTIRTIERVASEQPSVNMIVRSDVFRLSAAPDARYGVFAWTQGRHSGGTASDLRTFHFSLFYVDRLTEDRRNETQIQSTGIQTLENVLQRLYALGICAETWTFQTFDQRFADECAGVWCDADFQVPASLICPEGYGDYNNDFNEDFLIY